MHINFAGIPYFGGGRLPRWFVPLAEDDRSGFERAIFDHIRDLVTGYRDRIVSWT
jgi:hypothetical protein